ncbi:MAG: cation:proton antiporter [Bacteroidales bacterium]|jgi:Kef-type K+ transport system membrane component KefB|nr:cation:proton antiporter [Bacteroidales bacterium]
MHPFSLPLTEPVVIFMVVLLIVLLVPLALRRTNTPSIIGLIIVGIIMGPHALNVIADNDTIELFSTVGLLYIMFLAGLEIEFSEFRKNSFRSVFFGLTSFVFPFFLGYFTGIYILSLNIIPSLLIGILLSSNTLIAYPSANKLGISRSPAVITAVSGTVIADTLVLMLLAFATAMLKEGDKNNFLVTFFISFGLFTAVMFILLPKLSQWFFRYMSFDGQLQFIYMLCILFASAYIAELAGAEPIIGAFFAGLAVNRLIPASSTLMNRIDFVGNTLFIPFFLISVGMLFDLKILFSGFLPIIYALLLTVLALGGKWLAAWLTKVLFRQTKAEMNTVFGLTAARTAATLAVVMVGYEYGVLDRDIFNAVILLILITSLVSSYITEKSGRQLALEESRRIAEEDTSGPRRILVPIANPKNVEKLIDFAILLSHQKSQEPVYPLAIIRDGDNARRRIEYNKPVLEKLHEYASAAGVTLQTITRVDINIPLAIARVSKELNISEIIIGWSGRTNEISRIFGNMLEAVLRGTSNTVIVTHMPHPLNLTDRMLVYIPENAENEPGFLNWLILLEHLCKQLNCAVTFHILEDSGPVLVNQLNKYFKKHSIKIRKAENWSGMWSLSSPSEESMYVIINARTGTLSYTQKFYNLTYSLPEEIKNNNVLNIYPGQGT